MGYYLIIKTLGRMKILILALIAVQAPASYDASNSATFEVRTVGVDELSEEDGIMRSLNGADKAAAEDRFCWPPPTPSCVSSTDTRGPRVRFLERGNGFQLSN